MRFTALQVLLPCVVAERPSLLCRECLQSAKLNPFPADKMLSWAVGAGTALEEGEGSGWSTVVSDEEREEKRVGAVG